jgi:serine O-acetyltransferase
MLGLVRYIESVKARDPAARSRAEVLLYPGLWALAAHRLAHPLYRARLFFAARLVNHIARAFTGIDIHPGARLGEGFFIDHGFTVIGETAEIGRNVTIYQCVTLGGTDPSSGVPGKRHPTIEDDVVIGSGAQVLGPITVGRGARIGANSVVTGNVPPGAVMVGIPARPLPMEAEAKRGFLPYGTPCDNAPDPIACRIDRLTEELERLRAELRSERARRTSPEDRAA